MFHAPTQSEKPAKGPREAPRQRQSAATAALLARPSRLAVQRKCAGCEDEDKKLQTKLAVSEPGDALEIEADAVADRVMRMVTPQAVTGAAQPVLMRRGADAVPGGAPPSVAEGLRAPGTPLDAAARAFMEPRFGRDLGAVRIHTDSKAARSAEDVRALAYTVGSDIVFAAGQYAPHADAGRRLLAHELAHVVQQDQTGGLPLQRACSREILAEGTCDYLTKHSKYICCDPENGIARPERDSDIDGKDCPKHKFTPIFTCDNNCKIALKNGCSDSDNWMAVPNNQFKKSDCGEIYTICANGKSTKGRVRDHSVTETKFEVSPAIQKALGVTVGSSFTGAVYIPGAAQSKIDADSCCKAPAKAKDAPKKSSTEQSGPDPEDVPPPQMQIDPAAPDETREV